MAEELVFRPLAMARSSFIWDARSDSNRAYPHDAFGRPALSYKPGEANAAWSLQTTAADFALFLIEALNSSRLRPERLVWIAQGMTAYGQDAESSWLRARIKEHAAAEATSRR